MTPYTVAARTLCELTAKRGDLDLRFTPSPTSQQGIAGHQTVLGRRAPEYQREVVVSGQYRSLIVRGRADGFCASTQRVEEIKTFAGVLDRIPANQRSLHWAQAKVYGALLCRQLGLEALTVALVYFDIRRGEEMPALEERHTAASLNAFFEALCEQFLVWAQRESLHRERRDEALGRLRFPHASFRPGQRELAKSVYNAARQGRCLLAQAPTGIGKTMATLFPLLKACPGEQLDKVFFLTAKGSGHGLARIALETIRASSPGLPLRTLELIARDKACEHPDKACHGDSCPLARGFYDRLPAAREAAAQAAALTRAALREIALAHRVCPYYLGQEMVRWSDVIVADYHYYFDAAALLYALTQENGWRVGVLVDEAHNLLDRARSMYSASLSSFQIRKARGLASPPVKRVLSRLLRHWNALAKEAANAYRVLDAVPRIVISVLRETADALAEELAQAGAAVSEDVLQFQFDVLALLRLLEEVGKHALVDLTQAAAAGAAGAPTRDCTLSVRNVVPARYLAPRFAAARTVALFSATLAPWQFYIDTLGLPDATVCTDVTSPFLPEQLCVHITPNVSTRYRDRVRSILPIVDLIACQYGSQPGNYIAYTSSYEHLDRLAAAFAARYPQIASWQQVPGMTDTQRDAFLRKFSVDGRGVGFAVLGGAFGEGIDLVGTRLIGVFIATLGLPQWNDVNEEMRRRLDAIFGAGYDYAYLFPGIRKVVQAAGRVIRSETDRGVVHLIDDRFTRQNIRALLPHWWRIARERQ